VRKQKKINVSLSALLPVPTTATKSLCPANCSSCQDGICQVCDSGFALVSRRKNNSICILCNSVKNGKKVDKSQCGSGKSNAVVVAVFKIINNYWTNARLSKIS